jgi:hypothetical protein
MTMRVPAVLGTILAGSALLAAGPAPTVVLNGNGVAVGARTATFGRTPRAEAIALVTTALGRPVEQRTQGDCGGSDILSVATFRGDFQLTFVRGRLVGWTADGAGQKTAKGIAVGATLAQVRRAYPDIETDPGDEANGGLGASFTREAGPQGWLDGTRPASKVVGLYAGQTCIVS